MKSRQASVNANPNFDQDLEALRSKQRETTQKLQALEESCSNAWENIGDGG